MNDRLADKAQRTQPHRVSLEPVKTTAKDQAFITLDEFIVAALEQTAQLEKDRKLIQAFLPKNEVAFFTDQFTDQ